MKPVLILTGPTASGKSALALRIAPKIGAVILNADSKQVYREIPLISAQPSLEEKAAIEHLLYGHVPAATALTAPAWAEMAKDAIVATWNKGKIPLLVGGSGLYIRTLMEGMSPVPEIPESIRIKARALMQEKGNSAFHALLNEHDPVMATRLAVGDTQRVLRAYEVVVATGTSLATWQETPATPYMPEASFLPLVYLPPREENYKNANRRFLAMLEEGVLEEVQALDALGLDEALPAMKAHGVPEVRALLHGRMSREEAIEQAQRNTRHYIKRQHTWCNHQLSEAFRTENPDETTATSLFLEQIEAFLNSLTP